MTTEIKTYTTKASATRGLKRMFKDADERNNYEVVGSMIEGRWAIVEKETELVCSYIEQPNPEEAVTAAAIADTPDNTYIEETVMRPNSIDENLTAKAALKKAIDEAAKEVMADEKAKDIIRETALYQMSLRVRSTIEKPVEFVWQTAARMHEENPNVKRKHVIEYCIDAGVSPNTARTQYQYWFKASGMSAKKKAAREAAKNNKK